jgi:phosphatidylserine/phosphatidylglycerophosphate/cardiolipin synthase-like enzyme
MLKELGGSEMPTFLERMNEYLVQKYPGGKGTAFSLTDGNALPNGWLAQTPDIWGKEVDKVEEGENGRVIVEHIGDLIQGAYNRIDVATLGPFPDGHFLSGIKFGLGELARQDKREVTVRILAGYPIIPPLLPQSIFLEELVELLKPIKKARLRIYVAAQRTGPSNVTWNHSKIVAVDGERAFVGGENLWTEDYLKSAPVHDLNVRLDGPAVFDMHRFVNEIWNEVCGYKWRPGPFDWRPAYWETGLETIRTDCLRDINLGWTKPTGRGNMKVMGVGRYGRLKSDTMNPTDDAFVWAIDQAKRQVCLSQQDLLGPAGVGTWTAGINAIVNAIKRKCHVYIVVSNYHAKSGSGNPYSYAWGSSPEATYKAVTKHDSSVALKDYLHVASLRFGASDEWKGGKKFANHAKFAMVDDEAFYVGSCNFYPSPLIEYGVFLEDRAAIAHLNETYWNPLWQYSKRTLYCP